MWIKNPGDQTVPRLEGLLRQDASKPGFSMRNVVFGQRPQGAAAGNAGNANSTLDFLLSDYAHGITMGVYLPVREIKPVR